MATVFKSVAEICDVVSHLIYCPEDSTYLLTLGTNSNLFTLPSIKSPNTSSWSSSSKKDLIELFGFELPVPHTLRLYKVWIPNHQLNAVYHVVYGVIVALELKRQNKIKGNKYRGKIKWLTEEDILRYSNHDSLVSPEIIDFVMIFQELEKAPSPKDLINSIMELPNEFITTGSLVEVGETEISFIDNPNNPYSQIIFSATYKRNLQLLMYREFLFHCFPFLFISKTVFSKFVAEIGWVRDDASHLFDVADIFGRNGLSFREFILILAAIDPNTNHGGSPAEIRCRYIFRYFDSDRDGILNYSEFKNCVAAIRRSKKESVDPISVSRESDSYLKEMGLDTSCKIAINDFLQAVGNLKLRGSSMLLRAPVSAASYILDIQEREKVFEPKSKSIDNPTPIQALKGSSIIDYHADSLRNPFIPANFECADYELAVHTIRLQKSGTMINVEDIFTLDAVSQSQQVQLKLSPAKRVLSLDSFNQKSISNEVLKGLRYLIQSGFLTVKGSKARSQSTVSNSPYNWGQLDSSQFCKNLIKICGQVRTILKNESRLLEIQSPVYILGDLHGNFSDLLYFEKVLWHFGPSLCPVKILFLGDYVDRGPYSVEVIAYLFAYKLQCQQKLYLLRGNHEIRNVQKMFTFESECVRKFGEQLGQELWQAVNQAFDTMPLAAIVDSKIFCCHGGIPPPWLCPVASAINSIPSPLSEPDVQSPLAWEIMWNDPIRNTNLTETAMMELMANEGFASNGRRGTGHIFSVEALERFLTINSFSHVVRAHEVAQSGFNVQQNGKLLTVFSSSKYCGAANEAACIVCDQRKIRVLRITTT